MMITNMSKNNREINKYVINYISKYLMYHKNNNSRYKKINKIIPVNFHNIK